MFHVSLCFPVLEGLLWGVALVLPGVFSGPVALVWPLPKLYCPYHPIQTWLNKALYQPNGAGGTLGDTRR